jgi:hypothetical protein
VDKEKDEEAASSQGFWNVTDVNHLNEDARQNATITEMILLMKIKMEVTIEPSNSFFENDASI